MRGAPRPPPHVDKSFFDSMLENLWVPETFFKIAFIAVTMPVWLPLAKIMYREMKPALNAPEEELSVRRPAGEDPFLNIPLKSYRARRGGAQGDLVRRARR